MTFETSRADNNNYPLSAELIGASPAMRTLKEQIVLAAPHKSTVLVTGESGTGKELIARALHRLSPRRGAPFIPFNCTTTPTDLVENQLFGHRKGSFTGALADNIGIIRAAEGGTLFLDEIGDLPQHIQPKLLRFLQESEVLTLGEHSPRRVDVRVIAATNKNLEEEVAAGRFRLDLFHRLNVMQIEAPPLRERLKDIPLLAEHICKVVLANRLNLSTLVEIELDALAALSEFAAGYDWHGNVRELENLLLAAAISRLEGEPISKAQLLTVIASKMRSGKKASRSSAREERQTILFPLSEPIYGYPVDEELSVFVCRIVEKVITTAINQTGSKAAAARALGTDPNSLRSKLEHAQRILTERASVTASRNVPESPAQTPGSHAT